MVEGALESGHHLAHYTVIGKILRRAARALGTKSLSGIATARQRLGMRPLRRSIRPPKRVRRSDAVGSLPEAGSEPVAVVSRGSGAPL